MTSLRARSINACGSSCAVAAKATAHAVKYGGCMEPVNVVLYHNDAGIARVLAADLSRHFPSVNLARSCEEIRPAIARHRAEVLVLDVETSGSRELERLHQEFPGLCIVCTHRLADEELWTEALKHGATDMCLPWNTNDVVRSVMRDRARRAAA